MPAPAKIDLEQVVALRAADHGVRAIARALAVAPSSISRILRRPEIATRVERERKRVAAGARTDARRDLSRERRERGRVGATFEPVWLLVRSGSWGFGSRQGETVVMRDFPAGLYLDVDEEGSAATLSRRGDFGDSATEGVLKPARLWGVPVCLARLRAAQRMPFHQKM